MYLLILDEIDRLESTERNEVLYKVCAIRNGLTKLFKVLAAI